MKVDASRRHGAATEKGIPARPDGQLLGQISSSWQSRNRAACRRLALSCIRGAAIVWQLLDKSGHRSDLALNGPDANDPQRTSGFGSQKAIFGLFK